jgi:hypothetical protein
MTRWYRGSGLRRTILPTTLAVTASGLGVAAWALYEDGSDTLGDVAPYLIGKSGANLVYRALGSSQAENDMKGGTQSIGFMSRNFKSSVLSLHPTWQPDTTNVLGLDAAVLVESNNPAYSPMTNLQLQLDPNNPGKAKPDNDLALLLGGPSSTETGSGGGPFTGAAGTVAACRSQARLDAINRLAVALGASELSHFYRRNDASGTSDTIKERVRVSRYCNGQAPGGLKSDGVTLYKNSDAEDMDPIRSDCIPADPRKNPTKCTYWPYNVGCDAQSLNEDPNNPVHAGQTTGTNGYHVTGVPDGVPCSQGLVVAVTEKDPGADDVTLSIAHRVQDDGFFQTIGFAGRASVKISGSPTTGPTLNHISFGDDVVRANQYLLARRLYLNHGDQPPANAPIGQYAQETTLYQYVTGDPCVPSAAMTKYGFIACDPDCNNIGIGYNLCRDTPYPAAEILPDLCIATGKPGDGAKLCCATGLLSTSGVNCAAAACATTGQPCDATVDCCTGKTCTDTGTEPTKTCQ